jgi:hypothetical protein
VDGTLKLMLVTAVLVAMRSSATFGSTMPYAEVRHDRPTDVPRKTSTSPSTKPGVVQEMVYETPRSHVTGPTGCDTMIAAKQEKG